MCVPQICKIDMGGIIKIYLEDISYLQSTLLTALAT